DARRCNSVIVGRKNFFHVENIRYLSRRHAARTHLKDAPDNGCGLWIDLQCALFIRSENIAVWRVGHSVFAFLSILNADGAQLLTRSCRPPFIEYVGDR